MAKTALRAARLGPRACTARCTSSRAIRACPSRNCCAILKVTKQSLNRVLNDLLEDGFVERKAGMHDRRMRQLRLTQKGAALEDAIWEAQRPRLARAFREAGPDAVQGFRRVLMGLVDDRKPRAERSAEAMNATAGIEDPHLLVVDDDERLRALLQRYLTSNGFRVSAAANAEDARALMKSMAFDLLILDVMMPGESGLDFTRSVRAPSQVPILMLTARGEPEDRIEGLEHGADDYLPKPFEPRELVLRVRRAAAPRGAACAHRRMREVQHGRRRVRSRARRSSAAKASPCV